MDLYKRFVEKSIEAFILGLEIYNKPTIKYRIEGFSFFVCNAWELMLKAVLIREQGHSAIYYKDNPDRTISVSECVSRVYPDKYTRIRLNLEKIIDLRNISTHYITEDYEAKYAPLFQACALNFCNEMLRFHSTDITDYIAQNFLTITASYEPLSNEQIKMKYPAEIAEKLIKQANEIEVLTNEYDSDKFAINIRQNLYITRSKDDADFCIRIDKDASTRASIIKELKDPSETHKYSYNNVIIAVRERLAKRNIRFNYEKGFNQFVLTQFIDFYDVKLNPDFSYEHKIGKQSHYTYSQQFIEFIVEEIRKNPTGVVESLRRGNEHKKR
jgi:hypothetical protein